MDRAAVPPAFHRLADRRLQLPLREKRRGAVPAVDGTLVDRGEPFGGRPILPSSLYDVPIRPSPPPRATKDVSRPGAPVARSERVSEFRRRARPSALVLRLLERLAFVSVPLRALLREAAQRGLERLGRSRVERRRRRRVLFSRLRDAFRPAPAGGVALSRGERPSRATRVGASPRSSEPN